jgi:hypothetical protein
MPFQTQKSIFPRHAATVIRNPDKSLSATLDIYLNTGSACIQRILHQFLNHRSRPFYDLAGCDLVAQGFWEYMNLLGHLSSLQGSM